MVTKDTLKKSFWALSITESLEALETNQEGLNDDKIKERAAFFGLNRIPEKSKNTKFKILFDQLRSPLIFLLLIAGGITILVEDYKDAIVIFIAAIFNSLLGFYQENKAENALAHLKSYIRQRTRVIRNGQEFEMDTADLVPGDIIHLSQGDRVPADARIIYANNLFIDETILTGESLPVQKSTHPVDFQSVIGDQKSMAFSATLVVQGFGNAVVTGTGLSTEIGRIAALVSNHHQSDETPLQHAITKFSLKASAILIAFTSIVFVIGIANGQSPLHIFLTSVAIIVSAIPEGLPIALTVILAIGVQRLAKKNGVIRKLLAAETLGSTTVILTDKTGTLTQAKMFLFKSLILNPRLQKKFDSEFILRVGIVHSDFVIENPKDTPDKWRIVGRPLETTIVRTATQLGLHPDKIKKEMPVLESLPFNSATKYSLAIIEHGSKKYLTAFGAPEILLKLSDETPETTGKEITKQVNALAYSGARVVGLAIKEIKEKNVTLTGNLKINGFEFLGVLSFKDPVRSGVRDAIEKIRHAGIRTIIVTGDHRGTAEAIAQEIGLPTGDEHTINGTELDLMSEETLKDRLAKLTIVSRVSPDGKVKICKALRDAGEVVAMTGDGINDAPSLKEADIGIAMGSGTDVAKDVAELVLLDDNYHTIISAIEEGRRTMENIRKVIVYLLSSVMDELILIGGALLLSLELPLNPVQILWVNLITDSFPAIALAFENGIDHLAHKPRKLSEGLLDTQMKFLVFAIGLPTSFFLFGLYATLLHLGFDSEIVRTFIFASFGTYSLFLIFAVRSLRRSIFYYNPFSNPYILFGSATGLLLMLAAVYIPFMQTLLNTVSLPPIWLLGVVLIGIINILAIEFGKFLVNRKAQV